MPESLQGTLCQMAQQIKLLLLTRLEVPVEVAMLVHVGQRVEDLVRPVAHFGLLEQLVLVLYHLIQIALL